MEKEQKVLEEIEMMNNVGWEKMKSKKICLI